LSDGFLYILLSGKYILYSLGELLCNGAMTMYVIQKSRSNIKVFSMVGTL